MKIDPNEVEIISDRIDPNEVEIGEAAEAEAEVRLRSNRRSRHR